MSASLRFLAIAVVGWAGLRFATLEMLPNAEAFTLGTEAMPETPVTASAVPAIVPTKFPPIAPPSAHIPSSGYPQFAAISGLPPGSAVPVYYYYPVGAPSPVLFHPASLPAPRPSRLTPIAPMPAPQFYSPIPQLDEWPLSRIASAAIPARRSATASPQQSVPQALAQEKLDRLQLTAWALLRGEPGPTTLASGGMLGGSQAGARLSYNFTRDIALSLRSSSPVGGVSGGELAAGIRLVPIRSIPLALTTERRQALGGPGSGRSAFAMFNRRRRLSEAHAVAV